MRARFLPRNTLPQCPLRCQNGFLTVTPPYRRNVPVIVNGELRRQNVVMRGTRPCPHCEEQEQARIIAELTRWQRLRNALLWAFVALLAAAVVATAFFYPQLKS